MGEVAGTVAEKASAVPLAGAQVLATWVDPVVSEVVERQVSADESGRYRLCGLPVDVDLTLQAEALGFRGSPATLRLTAGETEDRDLSIAFGARGAEADRRLRTTVVENPGPPGRVVGHVLEADTGRPVAAALVGLGRSGFQATTDAEGRFLLRDVAAGHQAFRLRHLAYGERETGIDVPAGRTLEVQVRVEPEPIELEAIRIVVEGVRSLTLEIRGFYERKDWMEKLGLGYFLSREEIEKRNAPYLSYVLFDAPRVTLVKVCSHSARCMVPRVTGTPRSCMESGGPSVYVDNHRTTLGGGFYIDDIVTPSDVAGIEAYTGLASLPAEFADDNARRCGAIVIWTGN